MKRVLIIIIGFFVMSCQNSGRPNKPDNLIPKDQMTDILYDVFLLNAAKGINKKALENRGILPQEYVYKKYRIDSLQFALSNDYYSYDIKTYEEIIDEVKAKLEYEKKINDSLSLKEDFTKDSLREVRLKETKLDSGMKKLKVKTADFQ